MDLFYERIQYSVDRQSSHWSQMKQNIILGLVFVSILPNIIVIYTDQRCPVRYKFVPLLQSSSQKYSVVHY